MRKVYEYKVIEAYTSDKVTFQNKLNGESKDGWRLIDFEDKVAILEREAN